MSTLTTAPVAPLLDRLFEEAATAWPPASVELADLSSEDETRLMRSKTEYRELYRLMKDLPLPVVACRNGTLSISVLRALSFEAECLPLLS